MTKTLSSPLLSAANNIVSLGSISNKSVSKFQQNYVNYVRFLDIKTKELETIKLPDKKKIKKLSEINIANSFGSPAGLLSNLVNGSIDVAGFLGGMFPTKGKQGKPQSAKGMTPTKPKVSGGKLNFSGLRSVGVVNALFAGLDFATGLAEGETVGKAAAGAGGSLAGSLLGGAIGQALIPVPGLGFVVGSMAGGFLGGWASDRVYDAATGQGESTAQKTERRLKEEAEKQKQLVAGDPFKEIILKFDAAVSKFEDGIARGLFGTVKQVQVNEDVASGDYAETEEDQLLQNQDETDVDFGQIGGTFESHIKEFREFRNKQFGASKERFPTPNPQLYQVRELGIWEGGKQDNWKINPLADDTRYEKNEHSGAGHWENRAFDIPVPVNSKQGDMVAEFWRKKGYRVLWKTDKAHENHVHVEVPREKANDFFAGKLKSEDKKTSMSSDKTMMEGNVAIRNKMHQMVPQQEQQDSNLTQSQQQLVSQMQSNQQMNISQMIAAAPMNLQVTPQNIQYYPSYNIPGKTTVVPILMGGGGIPQRNPVSVSGPSGNSMTPPPIAPPSPLDIVNSLMKTMLLTNLSGS